MKIALDVSMLADVDPHACARKAHEWGFDGVLVPGGAGIVSESRWTVAPETPAGLRQTLAEAHLSLAALHTGLSLDQPSGPALEGAKARVRHVIALAAALDCQRVVVTAAGASREPLERTLARTVAALSELVLAANAAGVTLLLDNGGTALLSHELWHIRDAVGSPAVRHAFRPVEALLGGEALSVSIKCLAGGLEVVYVWDAAIDGRRGTRSTPLGRGNMNIALLIELLKGVAFDGWLCVSWPSLDELGGPDQALPAAVQFLRTEIARPPVVLSAYKGDKHAPRFRQRKPDADAASAG